MKVRWAVICCGSRGTDVMVAVRVKWRWVGFNVKSGNDKSKDSTLCGKQT